MQELNNLQKAQLVWELSIDMYSKPIYKAIEITHGREASKELNNLVYKYENDINNGSIKTLSNFINIFNTDLSIIDNKLLN